MRILALASLIVAAVAPFIAVSDATFAAGGKAKSYSPTTALSALFYAKAAYCPADTISDWSCDACGFHPSMTDVSVFSYDDLQAFVAYNTIENKVVVAFRGSSNIANWISDLTMKRVQYPPCNGGCTVHEGFFSLWQGIKEDITSKVSSLMSQYTSAELFVTGHSLGAAMSTLAAVELTVSQRASNVLLYNFGEPRVGDANFSQYAAATLPSQRQFRITHHKDPVPHAPPMNFGFLHVPSEVFYDNDGNTSYVECKDSYLAEDSTCSNSFFLPDAVGDHLLYLGISTRCNSGF